MANVNTLSIPQPITNQAPTESTTKKKKCSGTCENCLAKKRARMNQQAAAVAPTTDADSSTQSNPDDTANEEENPLLNVIKNELLGIEFDGETHRGLWSGCFRGTPDF